MSIKINKNGKAYPLGFMPQHYPADRVYLDGDTSKTVQDAIANLVEVRSLSDITFTGTAINITINNVSGNVKCASIVSQSSYDDKGVAMIASCTQNGTTVTLRVWCTTSTTVTYLKVALFK